MKHVRSVRDRESRSTRRIEAFLQRQNGQEVWALVTNISNRGCQLKPAVVLAVDELVRINLPRVGSIAATIRWVLNESAGAEFIPHSDVWEEVSRSSG
jgi:PilZ domain-containing protein